MKTLLSERCGNKHCAWVHTTKNDYFVSYRTIVAVKENHHITALANKHKYSPTTTKQITQCVGDKAWIDNQAFQEVVNILLERDGMTYEDITSSAKTGW